MITLKIQYGGKKSNVLRTYPNEYLTRWVALGAFTALGVMSSPCGTWWYSSRFTEPSAHGGMQFQKAVECRALAAAMETLRHAVEEGQENGRDWVTALDRQMLGGGTYDDLCKVLVGAYVLSFS